MSRKKLIPGCVLVVIILAAAIHLLLPKAADPAGYVQANLDLIFQGETKGASEYLDSAPTQLKQVYQEGIHAFTDQYLMGDMEIEGVYTETYDNLIKEVFAIQRYQIGEAKKLEKGIYEVTVTYQPVDIFTKFVPQIQQESSTIQKILNSGGYSGTQEEALASALMDYLQFAYEALEKAYLEVGYGEKESFTFQVKCNRDGSCEILGNGTNTFIERILDLDNL